MTLSLENKQGGKLKRWSLTTALWPRETGATVTCEQRCNIPLGMCCDVCAHTLLFVFQQCHSWNVTVLCLNVGLCAFQCQRSYSNNVNLRAKWKHCDKRNLVGTTPFFFLLFFLDRICITLLDAKMNVSHISVKKMQWGCLWMFGWLTHWSGCDTLTLWALSCRRVLLSLLALTHTSHHSPDRCPGASLVLTQPNPAPGPRALFWELKSHNCRADSDS